MTDDRLEGGRIWLQKMRSDGWYFLLESRGDAWQANFSIPPNRFMAIGETAQLAICRAALLAVTKETT